MPKHDTHEDTIEMEKPEAVAEAPPTVLEYDTPPPQFVAGTVVPQDTLPGDMTDAEYVQWCFDNRMPYWAIKKEVYLRKAPVLSGLDPSTAVIGDPSFTLKISGEGFVPDSVIVFAGQDEPTTLDEDRMTVSTGVNMGVWHGADALPVCVRNGTMVSEPLEFTFTAPAGGTRKAFKDYPPEPDDDEPEKKAKKKK